MSLRSEDTHPDAEAVQLEQWNDVIGILKVQLQALGLDYLRHWAAELDLTPLLERAARESGL